MVIGSLPVWWHFRGLHAAASLKRDQAEDLGDMPHDFRGLHAAASLKHGQLQAPNVGGGGGFPRPSRRGLIEA